MLILIVFSLCVQCTCFINLRHNKALMNFPKVNIIKTFVRSYTGDENDIFYKSESSKSKRSVFLSKFPNFNRIITKISDKKTRSEFLNGVKNNFVSIFESLKRNIRENSQYSVGQRGEELLAYMAIILSTILLGIHPIIRLVISLVGLACEYSGIYLILSSIWALKSNLSPFVVPSMDNYIVSDSVYDLIRHPMYSGIFLSSIGHAIAVYNVDKVILSLILLCIMNKAADREEELLAIRHPVVYSAYAHRRKKFIPLVL